MVLKFCALLDAWRANSQGGHLRRGKNMHIEHEAMELHLKRFMLLLTILIQSGGPDSCGFLGHTHPLASHPFDVSAWPNISFDRFGTWP